MKEIFVAIGKVILAAVKDIDWKKVSYEACHNTIIPLLKTKAAASDSKIDDVMVKGFESAVEAFLKPEAPKAA